jgi:hypothetical protein
VAGGKSSSTIYAAVLHPADVAGLSLNSDFQLFCHALGLDASAIVYPRAATGTPT